LAASASALFSRGETNGDLVVMAAAMMHTWTHAMMHHVRGSITMS
jgi:3,4-dihydroxy-2-butanone 4-phosphate synthase